jgi:hypothetical protein
MGKGTIGTTMERLYQLSTIFTESKQRFYPHPQLGPGLRAHEAELLTRPYHFPSIGEGFVQT